MRILNKIFGNARKPEGFFGRLMVNGMNGGSHAALAQWGLRGVEVRPDANVLDVGCGGGANIARLLERTPQGSVKGIDYSAVSVAKSRKVNDRAIANGRCEILEGSASALPFGDGEFDLVTAFETVYFWPDIEQCFVGIRRVLREGGRFVIVNEADGLSSDSVKWEKIVGGMHTYTPTELHSHLKVAGFSQIEIRHDAAHHRLAATAVKLDEAQRPRPVD